MLTNTTQNDTMMVDFDFTYDQKPQDILKKIIREELTQNASHLSTRSLTIKRIILLVMLGLITFISSICYFFYVPISFCLTIIVITWIFSIGIYKNLTLEKILCKKAIAHPDLDIHSMVQKIVEENYTSNMSPAICFLLACVLSIALPAAIFYQPKVFYSPYLDGYAVERYTKGIINPTEVTIPDVYKDKAVIAISSGAFRDSVLEEISLPQSITYIGGEAFYNATQLKQICIPSRITEIKGSTFENCTSLSSVTLPEGLERINSSAFKSCTNLTMIILPESLSYLGANAFVSCTSLQQITIPERVTEINGQTFAFCSSLSEVVLHENISDIGGEAFMGCCSLDNVILPSNITQIHGSTFENCSSLTSIDIPEGVTRIGGHAFYGCSSLEQVSIPASMEEIGSSAFRCCYSLQTICIPEHTSINERAFKESPTTITRY